MTEQTTLSEPAKLLLLASLLSSDRIISNNAKCFLKELILRRDPKLTSVLNSFESNQAADYSFIQSLHEIIKTEAEVLYNDLFSDTSIEVGKALSKKERERKNLNSEKSLIYGEVDFNSFYDILRIINPKPGLTFYDLGSGTGKAVFVARLTQDFESCIGIEILESLHEQADKIVDKYNEQYKKYLYAGSIQKASVYPGSFTDFDWSNGDVVFANSTCFDDSLMDEMTVQAEKLSPGSIVVTFTKGMTSDKFELLERKRYKMSWGPATVFIHRKLKNNRQPVGPSQLNKLPVDEIEYDDSYPAAITKTHTTQSSNVSNYVSNDDGEDDEDDDDDDYSDEDDGNNDNDLIYQRTQSPPPPTKDSNGDDIMTSPLDSALLQRKRAAISKR
eukprot:gene21398-27721_t